MLTLSAQPNQEPSSFRPKENIKVPYDSGSWSLAVGEHTLLPLSSTHPPLQGHIGGGVQIEGEEEKEKYAFSSHFLGKKEILSLIKNL